eukprot:1161644-Pelagomonas_calceolata.AAC.8
MLHESSMVESGGSSREGRSGEGEGRQDSFVEGECVEGVPTLLYVTNLFVAFTESFRGPCK